MEKNPLKNFFKEKNDNSGYVKMYSIHSIQKKVSIKHIKKITFKLRFEQ